MNPQKIGGLIVLLIGIPLGLIVPDRMLLSAAASIGLMMIFFAPERIDDERVQQLKMKAMFIAMSTGIAVTLVAQHYLFVILRGTVNSMPPDHVRVGVSRRHPPDCPRAVPLLALAGWEGQHGARITGVGSAPEFFGWAL